MLMCPFMGPGCAWTCLRAEADEICLRTAKWMGAAMSSLRSHISRRNAVWLARPEGRRHRYRGVLGPEALTAANAAKSCSTTAESPASRAAVPSRPSHRLLPQPGRDWTRTGKDLRSASAQLGGCGAIAPE